MFFYLLFFFFLHIQSSHKKHESWKQILHLLTATSAKLISNWFHKPDNEFRILQWPPKSESMIRIQKSTMQGVNFIARNRTWNILRTMRDAIMFLISLWSLCHEELRTKAERSTQHKYTVPNKVFSECIFSNNFYI